MAGSYTLKADPVTSRNIAEVQDPKVKSFFQRIDLDDDGKATDAELAKALDAQANGSYEQQFPADGYERRSVTRANRIMDETPAGASVSDQRFRMYEVKKALGDNHPISGVINMAQASYVGMKDGLTEKTFQRVSGDLKALAAEPIGDRSVNDRLSREASVDARDTLKRAEPQTKDSAAQMKKALELAKLRLGPDDPVSKNIAAAESGFTKRVFWDQPVPIRAAFDKASTELGKRTAATE